MRVGVIQAVPDSISAESCKGTVVNFEMLNEANFSYEVAVVR